jgi:hypothetical protein
MLADSGGGFMISSPLRQIFRYAADSNLTCLQFWRDNVFGFAGVLGVPLWKGDVTWVVLLET